MKIYRNIRIIFCAILIASVLLIPFTNVLAEDGDEPSASVYQETSDNELSDDTTGDSQYELLNEQLEDAPAVNGNGYLLYDALSDTVLLGENIDLPMEPASTTKVMTVLLAIETLNLEDIVTITPAMYESVPAGYVVLGMTDGEEFTVEDLINAALLESCNDAALALGVYMGGTEVQFCQQMNDRAAELGCTNTHFTSAYGYSDPNNTISPHDMALILEQAVTYEKFCSISTASSYTISATNKYGDARVLTNTNKFICTQNYSYDYYIAGKTGYTDSAGNTIVAAANKNGRILIGVIFGASDANIRYENLIDLFNYGYTKFTTMAIDDSDFSPTYNNTKEQIEQLLVNTNLQISDFEMHLEDYHTTTTERASSGYSAVVELVDVIIDTSTEFQSFDIPLYRRYSDGKSYNVGYIHLEISVKDKVVPITPEKHSIWNGIKKVLITIVVITGLLFVLIVAVLVFRNRNIKRKEKEFRNKSKML